jgi:hypothetical protein
MSAGTLDFTSVGEAITHQLNNKKMEADRSRRSAFVESRSLDS